MFDAYQLTLRFARFYLRGLSLQIEGVENIPAEGPAILAGNHPCSLDQLIMMMAVPRTLCSLQRLENFQNPLVGWWLCKMHVFPAAPGRDNSESFARIAERLSHGSLYLTAPEGDVGERGRVGEFHPGFARLAHKLNCPVIPVAITGSDGILRNPRRPRTLADFAPRRAWTRVSFLEPVKFGDGKPGKDGFQAFAETVRASIVRSLAK